MYIRLKEDYESSGLGTLKAGSIYKLNKKCGEEVYCDFVQKVYAISHKTEYEIANVRIVYNLRTGGFYLYCNWRGGGTYGLGSLSQHIFDIIDKPETKIKKFLKTICNTIYSTLTLQRKKS